MKNINMFRRSCAVFSIAIFTFFLGMQGANASSLTASTSLTIVNLTKGKHQNISTYPGSWPFTHDESHLKPTGKELYISNAHFSGGHVSWTAYPTPTPYNMWPNGINSILSAIWSKDQGKTFEILAWDYLGPWTSGKHIVGMPDCWMGTMVSSLCGQKAGECNGEYRSNLIFSVYPNGAACWGKK